MSALDRSAAHASRRPSVRNRQLLAMCRRRGCSREDARDIVQEAYLRFTEYYQRAGKVTDADALLRMIVINLSINHYHRVLSAPYAFLALGAADRRGQLVDLAPGPERTLAASQELAAAVDQLSATSARTCQIFIAHRGGYSYDEIASAFGVKERTIEKHVAAAHERITAFQSISNPAASSSRPRA